MRWFGFEELGAITLYEVVALREEVFVVEQRCAYLDADGLDPRAQHLLAHDGAGLAGYLRTFPPGALRAEAVIGRVVVRQDQRGTHLGRRLMNEAWSTLQATHGPVPVFLSAQAHLRGWYESLGYAVSGAGYDEDGIPHLPMVRAPG